MLYLDHNATTPASLSVLKAMVNARWANPNSLYCQGIKAHQQIIEAENTILEHINGAAGKLYWCQSGSMANYLAMLSAEKSRIAPVVSPIEHKSILTNCTEYGLDVCVPLGMGNNGIIDPNYGFYDSEKNKGVEFVACMYVNNEIGTVQPVHRMRTLFPNAHLHVDAVQALGKIPIDVETLGADSLTLSAHKIYGPKGIACLWVRDRIELPIPYLGTPATQLIIGFGQAVKDISISSYFSELLEKEKTFLNELYDNLSYGTEVVSNIPSSYRVPGTLSLQFQGVNADIFTMHLDSMGVCVSTGSACSKNTSEPSHVLTAIGLGKEAAKNTIRVSLGKAITTVNCIAAANMISKAYKELTS